MNITEINTLEDPINKNISKYYAIGAIIIITFIMFCFFIFYAYNKKSIIDKKDLQNKLNLSCLSSIPFVKKFNKNSLLITDKRTPYIVKEQIKKLRIKVEGWNRELGSKVFLVTSSFIFVIISKHKKSEVIWYLCSTVVIMKATRNGRDFLTFLRIWILQML